jgi:catechol 2,3-dioxygenase-like lactoylglutathione lyase family enzyme
MWRRGTDHPKREEMAMPGITDLGHGTLECADLAKTRFYEEVLGLEVIHTSPLSMMVRKGKGHTYGVVETGKSGKEMNMLNHNGLDVGSPEEVDAAYESLQKVKEEYGITKLQKPRRSHGDYAFYFCDLDGNWWRS